MIWEAVAILFDPKFLPLKENYISYLLEKLTG